MSDDTTPQDGKAMSPASAGSHGRISLTQEQRLCLRAAIRLLERGSSPECDRARIGLLSIWKTIGAKR